MARKPKVTIQVVDRLLTFDEAEFRRWQEKVAAWEGQVIADAQLTGGVPVIDYADRPFDVPPDVEAEIRRRRDPTYLDGLRSRAHEAQVEARHRRALAGMLREKGDAEGAAAQDRAADEWEVAASLAVQAANAATR